MPVWKRYRRPTTENIGVTTEGNVSGLQTAAEASSERKWPGRGFAPSFPNCEVT